MCPYIPDTHHLIDEQVLRRMRGYAVLLNCTRGRIADNRVLYRALSEGWIASAGLDDTEEQPAKLDSWFPKDNPLSGLDNCLITPHVAYISEASLQECRRGECARGTSGRAAAQPRPSLSAP